MRSQLNEWKGKNELLEQALRVLAQENLELELKKINSNASGANVSPLAGATATAGHKHHYEDEETLEGVETGSVINSEMDEFFDIRKIKFQKKSF